YSLGVIAYEMLCGQKPFKPDSPYQLLDMQREGVKDNPTDLRPDLPIAAEAAILKALAFEQDMRPARARDFGEEIANALTLAGYFEIPDVDPIPIVVPDPLPQTGSFWSRRKSVVISAFAVLIALVAVAVISQRLIGK